MQQPQLVVSLRVVVVKVVHVEARHAERKRAQDLDLQAVELVEERHRVRAEARQDLVLEPDVGAMGRVLDAHVERLLVVGRSLANLVELGRVEHPVQAGAEGARVSRAAAQQGSPRSTGARTAAKPARRRCQSSRGAGRPLAGVRLPASEGEQVSQRCGEVDRGWSPAGRTLHLVLEGQREEALALAEHLVDALFGDAVPDQIGKADVAAGLVEALADLAGGLGGEGGEERERVSVGGRTP